ncbi:MAG TPA: alpha/beta hydrolase [Aggregatilinea sp.]|jgi:pimeloyl-ACP methyl ester carboxylesterase|uniref:alpha/beta fold hydrolase n=1 Tax=Aggregatilinea sp. TaxID=2806333 RepID=UPI002C8E4206|nr:alpha/beta hydrolase [Aggregatilinea sp.]HML20802.1 alpha/beta hydrolase [Aggregatilinea sp.]
MNATPPVKTQEIAGLQTGVAIAGEGGQPVLALHGWGGSVQSFWPVAQQLAPLGYEVHVLDLPGFGQTAPPPDVWGVADYARFVAAYLDAAELGSVYVLGHSFGGRISLILGADYASRVRKMVLADAAGLRTTPSLGAQTRTAVAKTVRGVLNRAGLDGMRSKLEDQYRQRYASEDYRTAGALRETFIRVIEEDLSSFAERIQAPTVLIWGDQDVDTPLWQGQRLEQLIPDAGLIVFQGAGHFSYLERLGDYIRIVNHFLTDGS